MVLLAIPPTLVLRILTVKTSTLHMLVTFTPAVTCHVTYLTCFQRLVFHIFPLFQVKVASEGLHERIAGHIAAFSKALCSESDSDSKKVVKGTISLTFVTNRKGSWVLGSEPAAWERWIFNIEINPGVSGMLTFPFHYFF